MSNEYTSNKRPFYTTFKVESSLRDKLRKLKKELGFATYQGLFTYLSLEAQRQETIPFASYEDIFKDSKPVILTGSSGAGKSTCIKKLLCHHQGPVFVLDVSNEYADLKQIDLGNFFATNWNSTSNIRIRFVPNSSVEISKAEAATIFAHINFIKNGEDLKNWTFIVEEGHRFSADPNLRALLIEARKFMRKFLLVTTDWQVYRDIALVFKPSIELKNQTIPV